MRDQTGWAAFRKNHYYFGDLGLGVDVSRMSFEPILLGDPGRGVESALNAMEKLEGGALANVDEQRMVGHYWLRAPQLAPEPAITAEIEQALKDIKTFVADVHRGAISPPKADGFFIVVVIGVGGSVLGPQMACRALTTGDDRMVLKYIDNTDPEGIDQLLTELDDALDQTMTVVMSKSGTTVETRNAMLEMAAAYGRAGLDFAKHAVAVTTGGSELDRLAQKDGWLRTFPIWDWVGGRTSLFSSVGLLPAALQGADIEELLGGARDCDKATRLRSVNENPAIPLAVLLHHAVHRRELSQMVVIPYADRLELFARYLQQLMMESLGKQDTRDGQAVHEGFAVFGNKGSTDQHSYVQQLVEGPNNFFAVFVNVLHKGSARDVSVEADVTCGDYLSAFWQGTRGALSANGRDSITLTLNELNARSVGILVALFERVVGLYAELSNINAYNQPAVEHGKQGADRVIALQRRILTHVHENPQSSWTAEELAAALAEPDVESVYHILSHLAASEDHPISRCSAPVGLDATFSATITRKES